MWGRRPRCAHTVARCYGRHNKALQLTKRGGGSRPVWPIVINARFAAERQWFGGRGWAASG